MSVVTCLLAVQHILVRPDIPGLEDDDNVPPTPSPVGLDFSQPWHASVVASKELMLNNLHMCHPTMKMMLEMGHDSLGKILLINCLAYRSQGQLEFETLRNNIILESEKSEEKLKNRSEQNRTSLRHFSFQLDLLVLFYYLNLRQVCSNSLSMYSTWSLHSWFIPTISRLQVRCAVE